MFVINNQDSHRRTTNTGGRKSNIASKQKRLDDDLTTNAIGSIGTLNTTVEQSTSSEGKNTSSQSLSVGTNVDILESTPTLIQIIG